MFADLSGRPVRAPERARFAALPGLTPLGRVERRAPGDVALALRPGEIYLIEVRGAVAAP